MSVTQIEAAIATLPHNELAELLSWLDEYRASVWDKQIEGDLQAGRLDKLLAEVDSECESESVRPL